MHASVILEAFDQVDDVELGACARVVAKQICALDLQCLEYLSINGLSQQFAVLLID